MINKSILKSTYYQGPIVLVSRAIQFTFPLSYAYLTGYLKQKGENVVLLFHDNDYLKIAQDIMHLNPVLVGFGSLYPELEGISKIIQFLNQLGRQFPIVIGGQMVSPIPEFAVQITGADIGVIGEGEIILYQLASALRHGKDLTTIKGLVVREGNQFVNTGMGDYIEDLSLLPPIPYEFFPEENWLTIGLWYAENMPQPHWRVEDRVINVHGGRGCPFKCNFCYHHSKPRYRDLTVMIEEATDALERFDGNMLYFSDDLVLASPKRARKLVEAIGTLKRPVEYSISARFDILSKMDDALLYDMKKTGCRIMGLGIESGSDRILKIIGKNCTADMIQDGLNRLQKFDILPSVSIMVGQYTETQEDVQKSIHLMKSSVLQNPNINYAFTYTTPFPGSPLYDLIFQQGLLKSHKEFYTLYFNTPGEFKPVVNLSAMSNDVLEHVFEKILVEYKTIKPKDIQQKSVATISTPPHDFKERFQVPFHVDKLMIVDNNVLVVRCVFNSEDTVAFDNNIEHLFHESMVIAILGAGYNVFKNIKSYYSNKKHIFIQPYSRKNFPHLTQTTRYIYRWYQIITQEQIDLINQSEHDCMTNENNHHQTPDKMLDWAETEIKNGNHSVGINLLKEIIEKWPQYSMAYNDLGVLYWQMEDKQKALQYLFKGIETNPYDRHLLLNLGQILITIKEYQKAELILTNYLNKFNQDEEIQQLYAKLVKPKLLNTKLIKPKLLNIGCGGTFHLDWINIDVDPLDPSIQKHNFFDGLPFSDHTFDGVYHAHVLEHSPLRHAKNFMSECYRVLKPGGIIRVAIPDLEQIARLYLHFLENALKGDNHSQINYEWIMLELCDQMTRNQSGGEMFKYWHQRIVPAKDFIIDRCGSYAENMLTYIQNNFDSFSDIEDSYYHAVHNKSDKHLLKLAVFRMSGEAHMWMYDRFSLQCLMEEIGFIHIQLCKADQSNIPNFTSYHLDIDENGKIRKPDAIYMEASK